MSFHSLQLYHPEAIVEVVMDEQTHQRLVMSKPSELDSVVCNVVSIPAYYMKMQKSRFLKTRLRHFVSGDFLYLDLDTLVCESLALIDETYGSIGLILENHGTNSHHEDSYYPKEWKYLLNAKHFNGGVLYSKDNEESSRFFDQWHNNWKYCLESGCNFDQPGLRKAVLESDVSIEELGGEWNCQISRITSKEYQNTAKILHYQRNAFFVSICKKIRRYGMNDSVIIKWLSSPRSYFIQTNMFICQAECEELEPIRFIQYNYTGFYSFLVKISLFHRSIVSFLVRLRDRIK